MRIFRSPFTLLVTVLLFHACAFAQDFSNKGKEFWLAYCYHVGMVNAGGQPQMTLYITSDVATTYTVEIYGGATLQSGSIAAGQVVTATIPPAYFINAEGTFNNKAIRVTSVKPVVVYSYITRNQASGATLCLPTTVLGKEYYSMNFTQVSNEVNSNSYLTIIAVEDNTAVEITPSATTKNGWLANNTYVVNLNKGQIYQVLGSLDGTNTTEGADLTGTHVRSVSSGTGGCKRIAVFSGSGKIRIPASCNNSSSDNLYQQLYPLVSWGKRYLTAPSYHNPNNYYRIAKSNAAANVFVNGVLVPPASFTNGIWYEFFNSKPNLIESDLPISVTQYYTTQGCDGNTGTIYDPDMIVLNPVEQNISKVTLVNPPLANPTPPYEHHIQVVMRNTGTGISSFRLDGNPVTNTWTIHPGDPSYSYIYLSNVNVGYHTISSDSGFNALAYGFANAESYGYSAGSNVKDLYQFISIQNQYATVNFPAGCRNSPLYFSMTFPYQPARIQWVFGAALNAIGVADVTLTSPVYDSTWTVNGRQLYRYKLPTPYSISVPGTYAIQVLAQNPTSDGCSGDQVIDYDLQIFDPPTVNFSVLSNGCLSDSVHFMPTVNSSGRDIIKHSWSFGDGNISAIANPVHLYTAPNSYAVTYSVITDVGCLSDTARQTVSISDPPIAKFMVSTPVCEDKILTFTDQSTTSGPPITKWTWNFGDGIAPLIAANGNPQLHMYVAFGANNASLFVETSTGCKSALYTQPLLVSPQPFSDFAFNGACLPVGTTQFVDKSSIVVGSVAQWSWDFGDGTTSTQQSPVHNYSSTGPFNVTLTTVSAMGCTNTNAKVMDKVFAQPQAAFSAPASVCNGTAINFIDQSTAANSSIAQWMWDFGDGTTSVQQNPSKTYSVAGSYTVTLTVTSAAGCLSTVASKNIFVNPLPVSNFSFSTPNCLNQNIIFTDASAANAGTIIKWNWDFGDGSVSSLNSPAPFAHKYVIANSYTVGLSVVTDNGCTSALFTKTITVHPLPVAGFVLPESCLNDPFSSFIDSSSIADGSENSFSYLWDFGDANASGANPNTSAIKDPQHKYTATGSYTVTETVSSNNGCTNTIAKTFFVNGSVPVPSFALQESNSVCSGSDVHLTDNSVVNPGNIVKIEIYWDYTIDPTLKTVDDDPLPGKIYMHQYPAFYSPVTKSVTIRYVAYSGQTCVQYIDRVITLLAIPEVQFNSVQGMCKNAPATQLTQAGILNGLPGTGSFSGPAVSASGNFDPSAAGEGMNNIRYTFTANNSCTNFADQSIEVFPVPLTDAGPDKSVLEGGIVTLTPVIKANYPVTYLWSPATWLNSSEILSPTCTPLQDISYKLTVTSDKGCNSSDDVFVKILKTPLIPNIFSPNNDGSHDKWEVPYLASYPGCTIDVYNRYGQLIFHSVGYDKPWDGTVNGKQVPVGTYYYIIDPKNGRQKMSGYVDIIR